MACECEGCQKILETLTNNELLEELERRKAKRKNTKLHILKIFTEQELKGELSNREAEQDKIERDKRKRLNEELFKRRAERKNG